MKTLEALKDYDTDMKLKIGSAQCYFYVGTVGDIVKNHEMRDDKMRSLLHGVTRVNRGRLTSRLNVPPTWSEFIREEMKRDRYERDFSRARYDEYVDEWMKQTMVFIKAIDKSVEDEESYIPIANRTVKECGMADDAVEDDCVRMIVEGREHGKYWFTKEANRCACGINRQEE